MDDIESRDDSRGPVKPEKMGDVVRYSIFAAHGLYNIRASHAQSTEASGSHTLLETSVLTAEYFYLACFT